LDRPLARPDAANAIAVARQLCLLGYGPDELPIVNAAATARSRCTRSDGGRGLDADGVLDVRRLVSLIEAQRGVVRAADFARALLRIGIAR